MKRNALILLTCTLGGWLQAQVTSNYTIMPDVGIPEANPAGLTETFNVSGVGGTVANVQVGLDITGGFNGNLYAYLAGPQGQFTVLLNRVGVGGSNPAGYSDAGFNITLDDSGSNIHNYQSGSYTISGGQLKGLWAPDGRNIDPQSNGSAFDAASTGADFNVFNGIDANGTWTLFIADMSAGGGSANLNTLALSIMTVPEPQAWQLGIMALLVFSGANYWRNCHQFRG